MKQLTADELIELLPVDDSAILHAFDIAAPTLTRQPGFCKHLADEGWLHMKQVKHNGALSHLFGWHMTPDPDKGFVLDIVLKLGAPMRHENFINLVERFARDQGARYIQWQTVRRGIVHWAQAAGYTPEAVILTKLL